MKSGKQGRPLFLFHEVTGHVGCYNDLINALDDDITVYGVHAHSMQLQNADTIDAMASIYTNHIIELKEKGTFQFIGYSFGGLLATEVSRRVKQFGIEVGFLSIIDTRIRTHMELRDYPTFANAFLGGEEGSGTLPLSGSQGSRVDTDAVKAAYDNYKRHMIASANFSKKEYLDFVLRYEATVGDVEDHKQERDIWPNSLIIEMNTNHLDIMTRPFVGQIARDINAFYREIR
jgi:thioesterase domain-containing protein